MRPAPFLKLRAQKGLEEPASVASAGCVPLYFPKVADFFIFSGFPFWSMGQSCSWSLGTIKAHLWLGTQLCSRDLRSLACHSPDGLPWNWALHGHLLGAVVPKCVGLLSELQYSNSSQQKTKQNNTKNQNAESDTLLIFFLFLFLVHIQKIIKSGVGRVTVI